MRKKFTMLLASLLACVGVVKAAVTDLPEVSTEGNIKWYTIKNTRSGKYANYAGDAVKMTQVSTPSLSSLFYFTTSTAETAEGFTPVMIHNAATTNKLADFASWTDADKAWYLSTDAQNTPAQGLHITKTAAVGTWNGQAGWNALNDGGSITNYCALDAGSVFVIEAVEAATISDLVDAYKTAAISELNNYAVESSLYPSTTDDVAAVNAATPVDDNFADFIKAVDAIVVNYRNEAYQALSGKYFTIHTPARSGVYMQMSSSNVVGVADVVNPAALWQFVYNSGAVNVYNPYIDKYLCEPGGNSENIAVTSDQASAGAYQLVVSDTDTGSEENKGDGAIVKLTSNGKSVHMAGGLTLVRWDNGQASEWNVAEVTNISSVISSYKESSKTTLDSWSTLSVVFDAALIATAKEAINNIATTDYATFAAIDAELKNVADDVATKMFTFQTKATDDGRNGVWVSVNATADKAIGAETKDYNAIWSLRHAGGVSFYLYNELNKVYLGAPVDNQNAIVLTTEPTAAYTFEIIEGNVVEMKCNGGTIHASNHADDKLINYDGDEDASRWIITKIDIAEDIKKLLATLTEDDYAEVPALGQYPTAAYTALVEAKTSAKTVEEVDAAIAAFNASKNLPVFMISGKKDYVLGKSIYDNNSGTLYFKHTNVYDKTMWWAFEQDEDEVSVTDKVRIYNVGTGKGFWGAEYIKVTETKEGDVDGDPNDGIFLFYTVGNGGNPVHFQQTNQEIVRWGSTEATSGSAATFTFIGGTYELNKLTDEYLEEGKSLSSIFDYQIGDGLNQYSGETSNDFASITDKVKNLLSDFAEEADIEEAKTEVENAINGVALNMPEKGKFYRFKSVSSKKYVTAPDGTGIAMSVNEAQTSADNIFYWDNEGHLLVYGTGHYVNGKNHAVYGYKDTYTVEGSKTGAVGTYAIKLANSNYWHNNNGSLDAWQGGTNEKCNWWLEEVTTLPVTVTAAGYATLYAPVALTVAENVNVYTAEVAGNYVTLSDVATTIPANTGVIIKAAEGTYNFAITDDVDAIEPNDLQGSYAKSVKNADVNVYTLQAPDEKPVGFYLFNGTDGTNTTYINGFRAWIELPASSNVKALSIGRGEGTTSIDELSTVNGQQTTVIYDLTGRRVEKMEKGIYIVNGRKVIVK